MKLGKNLPQSAQSESFYYLLITLLLRAGEFSNLLRLAGRRVGGGGCFSSPEGQKAHSEGPAILHPRV